MVTLFKSEAELFSDIRFVNFGELHDIEVPEEGDLVELALSPKDELLLALLREGCRSFDVLQVHNGQPAFVLISGVTRHGNHFRQKIQIS
jgi:hypothetical protein